MARPLNASEIYEQSYETFLFTQQVFREVLGEPEKTGIWMIDGEEKHGKTGLAMLLANELKKHEKVLYVSAEEGTRKTFRDSMQRMNVQADKNLSFLPYAPLDELEPLFSRRRLPYKVVIIDNLTVYASEMKTGVINRLFKEYRNRVLFIYMAHKEKGQLVGASAKLVRRLSEIIFSVEGLAATVGGRCPGGHLIINEEKAMLYHGAKILNQ